MLVLPGHFSVGQALRPQGSKLYTRTDSVACYLYDTEHGDVLTGGCILGLKKLFTEDLIDDLGATLFTCNPPFGYNMDPEWDSPEQAWGYDQFRACIQTCRFLAKEQPYYTVLFHTTLGTVADAAKALGDEGAFKTLSIHVGYTAGNSAYVHGFVSNRHMDIIVGLFDNTYSKLVLAQQAAGRTRLPPLLQKRS